MTEADGRSTLKDVPGPQAPAVVAAIGLAVGRQVLDGSYRGVLRPCDVALDDRGAPLLSRGAAPTAADDPHAPDRSADDTPTALYGLGRALELLATGRPHDADATRGGQRTPPELAAALQLLTHHDPHQRHKGVQALSSIAGPLPDLRLLTTRPAAPAARSTVGQVRFTTTSDQPTHLGQKTMNTTGLIRGLLAVPAHRVATLSPGQRTQLAGIAGVPRQAVDDAITQGSPLPVAVGRPRDLSDRGAEGLPLKVVPQPSYLGPVAGSMTALAGLGLLAAAAPVLALSSVVAGVIAAFGALAVLGGAALWVPWFLASRDYSAVADVWKRWADQRANLEHDLTGPARQLVALIAQQLCSSDLSEPAQMDLRDGLRDVEQRLLELESQWSDPTRAEPLRIEAARIVAGLQELRALIASDDQGGTDAAMGKVLDIARRAAAARITT